MRSTKRPSGDLIESGPTEGATRVAALIAHSSGAIGYAGPRNDFCGILASFLVKVRRSLVGRGCALTKDEKGGVDP